MLYVPESALRADVRPVADRCRPLSVACGQPEKQFQAVLGSSLHHTTNEGFADLGNIGDTAAGTKASAKKFSRPAGVATVSMINLNDS